MMLFSVLSSNLSKVGYENGTLYIEFHSGGFYRYSDVPEYVYRELMSAESKGKYFAKNIKNVYAYQRIG